MMYNFNEVVLVDEQDRDLGTMEKLEAHRKGLLHRAFSVFLFNASGELLLQRRAFGKYHSEGLWTNTCCSHPAMNEPILEAGQRRLEEEMGISCDLHYGFSFLYSAELDNDLKEHELDHVLYGYSDNTPHLNTEEAIGFKWMSLLSLQEDLQNHPENYTAWLRILIENHFENLLMYTQHESMPTRNL